MYSVIDIFTASINLLAGLSVFCHNWATSDCKLDSNTGQTLKLGSSDTLNANVTLDRIYKS